MADDLDPRTAAFRTGLAALSLKGRVEAERYVPGTKARIVAPSAPLRHEPRFDAPLDTEALYGEELTIYDESEGWAWVQLAGDGYVGYTPLQSLSKEGANHTHYVSALRTFVYPAPDIKTPPLMALPLMSRLDVLSEQDNFLALRQGGFLYGPHARPLGHYEDDFVAVALRFLESPYLWGGRCGTGLDCSALVQLSLLATGLNAPRDSDMQAAGLGAPLSDPKDLDALQRGDLIFWKGHVGIISGKDMLLHANAHHMKTVIEPLRPAIEHIAATGSDVTCVKRL